MENDLGNIVGISKLIDETVEDYTHFVEAHSDPANPTLPRLQFIGGIMMRLPLDTLWQEQLPNSYVAAQRLGYRGTIQRWGELIKEQVVQPQKTA